MNVAAARLVRALVRSLTDARTAVRVEHRDAAPWASVTFSGERHTIAVQGEGPAFDAWLAALPEAELTVAGWLVADCAVVARHDDEAVLEVLLLAP